MYCNSFEGLVSMNATATAGSTGTGEQTLMSFSIPANSLYKNGQAFRIKANFHNNSSDTVTWKLYFGSANISQSVTTTTAASAEILAVRNGSKTQQLIKNSNNNGTVAAPAASAGSEDDTAAILVKLTATAGSSGANATADLLSVEFLQNP